MFNQVSKDIVVVIHFPLLGYIDAKERGLTGGLFKTAKSVQAQTPGAGDMMMSQGEAPKMFKIGEPTDQIKSFRVSKDAVIAAVVLGNDDIHIYRVRTQA